MMRHRALLALTVSIFTLALFASASSSDAQTTIKAVSVTIGSGAQSVTFCDTTQPCSNKIWNLSGGVNLGASQTLILTQTGPFSGGGGGNFDTSDRFPVGPACTSGTPCLVTISIDSGSGLTQVYSNGGPNPLNASNAEPSTSPDPNFNEAADWATVFSGPSYTLALGYADNEHFNACADADHDCFPQPNFGTGGATVFLGAGINASLGRCTSNCYDAGALLITALAPPHIGPSHGCTPGFWKNHATNPPWGSYTPSQKVGTVFTIPSAIPNALSFSNETLLDALQGGGGFGLNGKTKILLRAAVAALLNADNGNPPYPAPYSTPANVISATNAALASLNETTITDLATTFDTLNNGCDSGS